MGALARLLNEAAIVVQPSAVWSALVGAVLLGAVLAAAGLSSG